MGIVDDDIARVRAATDIVSLVGEFVQLSRVGQRWRGLCPFHAEKTGSFYVNAIDGLYHCFGCQASGDVITFVREVEHLDFVGAVERLAAKAGIALTYTTSNEGEGRRERARLAEILTKAGEWYHERLLTARDASAARRYLRDRGFDGDEVRRWKLGWAPDGWDEMCSALRLSTRDLRDTGLGFENKRGRRQDLFRGRILFPIHDPQGVAVGFGGRLVPGADGPKYINTPQTKLYDKSRVLFALDAAKAGIVQADEVIVCEGYTDVIAFFRCGLGRAVATCGTALTEEHVTLLRRFARRIVLAFDADSAGQAAAARFYEWERKLDLDVHVAALPPGVDPGELGQRDPDALSAAVTGARPFLSFRLDRALEGIDTSSPEARARAAGGALAVIAEHPNELVRDQYLMQVATRCRIEPDLLRRQLAGAGSGRSVVPARSRAPRGDDGDPGPADPGAEPGERGRRPTAAPAAAPRKPAERGSPAVEVLRLAVNRPEDVVEWLDEVLFDDPLHLATYRALVQAESIHGAIESAPREVAELLSRLAVEEPADDALDPVYLLLRNVGLRALAELRARAEPDLGTLAYLARLVDRVGASAASPDEAGELLAFVSRRGTDP